MDTDSLVLGIYRKGITKNLIHFEDIFDSSNLSENHELFSNENEKIIGKFEKETTKKILIHLFGSEVKCMHLNVEMIVKINRKVFANLSRKILNLSKIRIL